MSYKYRITKQLDYYQAATSGAITSASNGLTTIATDVQLGGTLTKNTTNDSIPTSSPTRSNGSPHN